MKKVSVLWKTLIFAVAVVASYSVANANKEIEANKGISRGGPNRPIGYANFKAHKFSYLNITILGESLVERGSVCALACLETAPCFSFNLAAFPDINAGKLWCELLPSDKYNNSEKFVHSNHFHHFSTASPCSSSPCKNNGKCVSLYEQNSYVCVCSKRFTGKSCEKDVNECASGIHNCSHFAVCNNTKGSFNCICKQGYTGDGFNCTETNECESSPCLNNGTCKDEINGFNCSCPPAFVGKRCETGFSLNSKIISNNEFYLSNLSMFLAPAVGNDSKWLLCYRASTHGWNVSEFHSRCDGINHTVTIIQVNHTYIFGGYTDIAWESSYRRGHTSKAFIFSLSNKEDFKPFKSNVRRPTNAAIHRRSSYGPIFGYNDIVIADQANSNSNSYTRFGRSYHVPSGVTNRYTILAGTAFFTPDDWEVFYLA